MAPRVDLCCLGGKLQDGQWRNYLFNNLLDSTARRHRQSNRGAGESVKARGYKTSVLPRSPGVLQRGPEGGPAVKHRKLCRWLPVRKAWCRINCSCAPYIAIADTHRVHRPIPVFARPCRLPLSSLPPASVPRIRLIPSIHPTACRNQCRFVVGPLSFVGLEFATP